MLLRRKSPCQLGPSTQSGHVIVPNPFGCWALTKIECTEDRDENNRTRCYGRYACTCVDARQRGA